MALHFSHVLALLLDHPSAAAPAVQARWRSLPLGLLVPWVPQMLSVCGPGAAALVQDTLLPMLVELAKHYTQHVRTLFVQSYMLLICYMYITLHVYSILSSMGDVL